VTPARRALLLAGLGGAFLHGARAVEGATLKPWTGPQDAPPIELLRPDGVAFSLKQLRGKVVLVNFWATWCEPCIAEMPSLQRLRDDLGTEHFDVLGVNFQEGPARIEAFTRASGVTFPLVRDTDGAVARAWGARVFPSSFIVDRNGRIRYTLTGEAEWTNPALISTIRSLLGPPPKR
jgi:peroxiredoxin